MLESILIASLLLRPTFNACSVESELIGPSTAIEYRSEGGAWTKVESFHGSLMGLSEDCTYEVRLSEGSSILAEGSFRTWKSDVPVAKTIELDPATFTPPMLIDAKGSPEGWIRYTFKGGSYHNPEEVPTFNVEGAEYVLLDDMTLTGAAESSNVIVIRGSSNVRVRGCDISGWGRHGIPDFRAVPGYTPGNGRCVDKNGNVINRDGAILIGRGSSCVVVERCYMHDAIPHTASWFYSHPTGSECIWMDCPDHSTVIRYNDFVGSDSHCWNDCVEGNRNFYTDGGFNQDADIYGNFMIFANDDCIEIDGGQKNVRVFGNRFESALCGVSVQGCMVGPSFVYDNLFSGMGEEFAKTGQTIKTDRRNGPGARTFIWDNTFWGRGSGVTMRATLQAEVSGNTFCAGQQVKDIDASPSSSVKDNRMGVEIEEKNLDSSYPRRDLPFTLSAARISVGLSRKPVSISVNGKLPKDASIRKPQAFDWFDADIKKGKICVSFHDEKMQRRRLYRGAFLVSTPGGLSRPVSIYAETEFVPPYKADKPGDFAWYAPDFKLEGRGESRTVEFDIPEDGNWWIMLYGCGKHQGTRLDNAQIKVSVDGSEKQVSKQPVYGYPCWAMIVPDQKGLTRVHHYYLRKGRHSITVSGSDKASFTGLVITDNPGSFEPNENY